ncbi:MAG: hypothetical protein JWN39_4333 [Ilumatobacteraceae bacterium]|nr:hypothetical protein [Ilumatobacteraceae bacterium]
MMIDMHTHHIPNTTERPASRTFPKRAAIAGAVLSSVVGLSAFATSAHANEFNPVPHASFASSCNGPQGVDDIILSNTGSDTAHFTIQWDLDGPSGTDFVDVVPNDIVTKEYLTLEGHYAHYTVTAPGQPAWWSTASSYTDCVPSPIGVIKLVCPSDGSSAYLQYTYSNHSVVPLQFQFGYPDGTTSTEQVDASSGDPVKTIPVAEDTLVDGFIKGGGQALWSFSQTVDCLPPIPATTIPETSIPATTISETTIPATVPVTVPASTVVAMVPPLVEQLPPTVPPTTAFVPGPQRLPATGNSSGIVAILAGGMLVIGTVLLTVVARRKPRSGDPA